MKIHETHEQYQVVFDAALIGSILLAIVIFKVFKFAEFPYEPQKPDIRFEVSRIDLTGSVKRAAPPRRPAVPIASEQETLLGDETIDDTGVNLREIPPPPPLPKKSQNEAQEIFVSYDTPPVLKGGSDWMEKNLQYPAVAKKMRLEGKAVISAVIDEKGNVVRTEVLKEEGNVGFGKAAMDVIMKAKFSPALQQKKPVKVKISIPVPFTLK
jgi:TonB family protein